MKGMHVEREKKKNEGMVLVPHIVNKCGGSGRHVIKHKYYDCSLVDLVSRMWCEFNLFIITF